MDPSLRLKARKFRGAFERTGLVRRDKVEEYVIVAITDAGERVAEGKQIVDGAARPTRK
ncbi:hypothetical protein NXC14_PA00026 (plasmid) [Rhizobium sp. NXC14]|nr:hypothetical protein NXC14_PA00026 [Rhizobium sp. NXC14]